MFGVATLLKSLLVGIAANSTEYGYTQATPRTMNDARTWHGRVRCQYSEYTFAAASAGSVITMCAIPKDSRIVGAELNNAALGTGVTVAIGDTDDADRLIAAVTCTTAGITKNDNVAGFGYVTTGELLILATTAAAAATGQIKLLVFYMID